MKKRQFPRLRCRVKSTLEHHGHIYHGHIENISQSGALLRLQETVGALPGDVCRLSVYPDEVKAPLKFSAEMVHVGFSMAGMRFIQLDEGASKNLTTLLEMVALHAEPFNKNIFTVHLQEG